SVDGALGVFGLSAQCGILVGLVLCHIELTCNRHLHRVEAEAMRLPLGPVDGNALSERRRRSILIENEVESARGGAPDRIRIAGGHPERRMRLLRRRWLDHDVLELPIATLVRKPRPCRPGARHHFERLLEARLRLLRCNLKSLEFAVAITLANAEIEPAGG